MDGGLTDYGRKVLLEALHLEVERIARQVASYVTTHRDYDSFSKEEAMVEAVRVCLLEALPLESDETH